MKNYLLNLLEAFSQGINAIHGGDPNQTFSARAATIRNGGTDYWILPAAYWSTVVFLFETFWPGHLDWAAGPD